MFRAKEQRDPHLWEALVSLLSLVVGIIAVHPGLWNGPPTFPCSSA